MPSVQSYTVNQLHPVPNATSLIWFAKTVFHGRWGLQLRNIFSILVTVKYGHAYLPLILAWLLDLIGRRASYKSSVRASSESSATQVCKCSKVSYRSVLLHQSVSSCSPVWCFAFKNGLLKIHYCLQHNVIFHIYIYLLTVVLLMWYILSKENPSYLKVGLKN